MSEAQAYSAYPMTLSHPAFEPSKAVPVPGSQVLDAMGNVVRQDYRGTPQRFPPVTVTSEADEEYHLAQGYQRAGKVDPSAWVRAHSSAPPEEYRPAKYPMWRDGLLIMTAQEDPLAGEEEPEPQVEAKEAPIPQPGKDENLRAMLEQMNETMRAMSEQMAEAKAEAAAAKAKNAELEAMLDAATAPPEEPKSEQAGDPERRGPGRPRKTA